jgi:hypothetical protein
MVYRNLTKKGKTMKAPPVENLIETWQRITTITQRQTEGITQAESLLRPPVAGNCMNWVLGHMLENRDTCLEYLGQPRLLSTAETATYQRGSAALEEHGAAVELSILVQKLAQSGEQLATVLQALPAGSLESEVLFYNNPRSLGGLLAFLQWHETYHLGQLELLRQLVGKTEKII